MNISRFEPLSLINVLHRDLDQIAARRFGASGHEEVSHSVADWVPAVDIIEEKERFLLRADVPGVNGEDIDINMENGVLSVSGQRIANASGEAEGLQRLERANGKFYRRFTLPETANAEEISATSSNGILEIIIPKQPQVSSRRITVKST